VDRLAVKVAIRFAETLRKEVKDLTHPINKPKGIDKGIVREHGKTEMVTEEAIKPQRTDIRPEDVFPGTPRQVAVRSLYETGEDQQKAIQKQIPRDKGYDTVRNLSQYLISTEGGGGTKPVGT